MGANSRATRGRPNILIIVTDDQRARGTLDIMPGTTRWLANGGARFTRASATTPICCPSRATLFTGQYAHNHNVLSNEDGEATKLPQDRTIQRYLQAAGYRTAIFGKYLNGWPLQRRPPNFDRFAISHGGYNESLFNVEGTVRHVARYSTSFVSSEASRFLDDSAASSRPWFLYVAPFAPHLVPHLARPRAIAEPRYRAAAVPHFSPGPAVREADRSDKPLYVRRSGVVVRDLRRIRRSQLRSLMSVDDMVETLRRRLRASGELSNTLVLFTSDNGFLWGEHDLIGKAVPYTESTGIPLLLSWPGHVRGAVRDRRLAGNIDVAPTVLDAAGVSHPPMDGRSLLGSWTRSRILLETWGSQRRVHLAWASLRTRALQYVEYYAPDFTTVRGRELYDLRADPRQLHNLLADAGSSNDPRIAALSRRLRADRACAGAGCP